MSNKITNPYLKQMIAEIANKSSEGRLVDVNWTVLKEGKKKSLKKEANKPEPKKEAPVEEPKKDELPELPDLGGGKDAPAEKGAAPSVPDEKAPAPKPDAAPEAPASDEPAADDAEDAQADAAKAKAELEKAKAEKERAEQELQQNAYIKLGSNAGVQFLLGKILDHAFKTNTIDALAGEMVQKLKIQTPEDLGAFSEDTAAFRVIPGMPELLASMKTLATKQPDTEEEPTP